MKSDEVAESEEDSGVATEGDQPRRSYRLRSVLLFLGVLLLVGCATAGVVGYVVYDRATEIDRSTPVVVVEQYVYAVFDDRNLDRAALFECDNSKARGPLKAVLDDLIDREQRFSIRITVSTANYSSVNRGTTGQVQVDLLIDVPEADGRPSRSRQRWEFAVRNEDGWRVCSARRAA